MTQAPAALLTVTNAPSTAVLISLCLYYIWIDSYFIYAAQGKSISQAIIFIYCMYQEYYNHCKKPWDEKQADVITSEISGPSGYTPVSPPLISVLLIPTYNHIPDLSDRLQFSGGPAILCDKIWPWWGKWKKSNIFKYHFHLQDLSCEIFFSISAENLSPETKENKKAPKHLVAFSPQGLQQVFFYKRTC